MNNIEEDIKSIEVGDLKFESLKDFINNYILKNYYNQFIEYSDIIYSLWTRKYYIHLYIDDIFGDNFNIIEVNFIFKTFNYDDRNYLKKEFENLDSKVKIHKRCYIIDELIKG